MTFATMPCMPADGYGVLALDPKYDGSCPCAEVVIDGVELRLHCWHTCMRCDFAGVHYADPNGRVVAERVVELMNGIRWGAWQTCEGLW